MRTEPAGGPRGAPGVMAALVEAESMPVSVVAPSEGGGVIESEVEPVAAAVPVGELPLALVDPAAPLRSFPDPDPPTALGPLVWLG